MKKIIVGVTQIKHMMLVTIFHVMERATVSLLEMERVRVIQVRDSLLPP